MPEGGADSGYLQQDKQHLIQVMQRVIPLVAKEPLAQRLWVVEETRIRIRGSEAD